MASLGGAWPLFPLTPSGVIFTTSATMNVFALDADTDTLTWVFRADETGPTYTKAAIRLGTLTGTSPVYRLSLQGVSGRAADGTVKGGASPASVTLNPSTGGGTVQEYTFANPYNASPGEPLALVIDYSSGTIDASNYWSFTRGVVAAGSHAMPFSLENTTERDTACFGLFDGSVWSGWGLFASAGSAATVGSSPLMAGNLFTLPAGMGDTVSCVGACHNTNLNAGSLRMSLYDASDTLLASVDWAGSTIAPNYVYWDDGPIVLTCGQSYRIVATTSSGTTRVFYATVGDAAHWSMFPFGGMVTYTEGTTGAWTETTTRRASVGILIDDITAPSGGGGGGGPVIGSRIIRGLGAL